MSNRLLQKLKLKRKKFNIGNRQTENVKPKVERKQEIVKVKTMDEKSQWLARKMTPKVENKEKERQRHMIEAEA